MCTTNQTEDNSCDIEPPPGAVRSDSLRSSAGRGSEISVSARRSTVDEDHLPSIAEAPVSSSTKVSSVRSPLKSALKTSMSSITSKNGESPELGEKPKRGIAFDLDQNTILEGISLDDYTPEELSESFFTSAEDKKRQENLKMMLAKLESNGNPVIEKDVAILIEAYKMSMNLVKMHKGDPEKIFNDLLADDLNVGSHSTQLIHVYDAVPKAKLLDDEAGVRGLEHMLHDEISDYRYKVLEHKQKIVELSNRGKDWDTIAAAYREISLARHVRARLVGYADALVASQVRGAERKLNASKGSRSSSGYLFGLLFLLLVLLSFAAFRFNKR
jgi:hypothetical protein